MTINWVRDPIYGYRETSTAGLAMARRVYSPLWQESPALHRAIEDYPRPVDLCMDRDGKIRIDWTTARSLSRRSAELTAADLHDSAAIDVVRVRLKLDATC